MNTKSLEKISTATAVLQKIGLKKLGATLLALLVPIFFVVWLSEPERPSLKLFRSGQGLTANKYKPWNLKSSGHNEGQVSLKRAGTNIPRAEVVAPQASIARTNFGSRTTTSNPATTPTAYANWSPIIRHKTKESVPFYSFGPIGGGDGSRGPGGGNGGGGDGGNTPNPPSPAVGSPSLAWNGASMSGDGKYRTLIAGNAPVYVSADGGSTWRTVDIDKPSCVAVSYYGQNQIIGTLDGELYGSADYGQTWKAYDLPYEGDLKIRWRSVATSDDGQLLMAVDPGGYIWQTYDWGDSWETTGFAGPNWVAGEMDFGGQFRGVAASNSWLYASYNGGQTWKPVGESRDWTDLTTNYNAQFWGATVNGGYIYISTDFMQTWQPRLTDNVRKWVAIKCSGDGRRFLAAESGGSLYTSGNFGVDWEPVADKQNWSDVSASVDFRSMTATVMGGYVYSSTDSGAWKAQNPAQAIAKSTDIP
ncbi:MAG: hypothetical protein WC711_03095 [Candidatus Staskawiczbacteria bacterium]|jgi:photosystem II stability/assembly factor-like uncharacterized protein